jgi:hypothetical protein
MNPKLTVIDSITPLLQRSNSGIFHSEDIRSGHKFLTRDEKTI